MKWQHSVNQLIRDNWQTVQKSPMFNTFQLRHLNQLRHCRTARLGGHVLLCAACGYHRISYNSCRNRHCNCQALRREQWIIQQEEHLLNVPYFHLVFTLPHELNGLCLAHPRLLYTALFRCAWQTIRAFAADPKFLGARTGATMVLHSWGQNLSLHPHIHCIVPGGGIDRRGKWKSSRSEGKYLFPRNALRKVFRGKFCSELKRMTKCGDIQLPDELRERLYAKKWVVYAKRPFQTPRTVVEYLGRYTHRVAISNYRIKAVEKGQVTFSWKDYRQGGKVKLMTVIQLEFLRRFCLHLLPDRFQRIRHYGILSSRGRSCYIPHLQRDMGVAQPRLSKAQRKEKAIQRLKIDATCPCCQQAQLRATLPFGRDGPPSEADIVRYSAIL